MKELLDTIVRPHTIFREIRAHPRWVGAFGVLAAFSMGIFALQSGGDVQNVLAHLPPSALPADREALLAMFHEEFWRTMLFLPFRLLLGWSAFAFALYVGVKSVFPGSPVRYLHLQSLEVHAEVLLLLAPLCSLAHLPFPSGAEIIRGPMPFAFEVLLTSINLSTFWYILVLSAGIAVLVNIRMRAAIPVVVLVWGLSQLLNVVVLTLLIRTFHFLL
jgi:hypothetical protein